MLPQIDRMSTVVPKRIADENKQRKSSGKRTLVGERMAIELGKLQSG